LKRFSRRPAANLCRFSKAGDNVRFEYPVLLPDLEAGQLVVVDHAQDMLFAAPDCLRYFPDSHYIMAFLEQMRYIRVPHLQNSLPNDSQPIL